MGCSAESTTLIWKEHNLPVVCFAALHIIFIPHQSLTWFFLWVLTQSSSYTFGHFDISFSKWSKGQIFDLNGPFLEGFHLHPRSLTTKSLGKMIALEDPRSFSFWGPKKKANFQGANCEKLPVFAPRIGLRTTMSAHEQLNWRPNNDRKVCSVSSLGLGFWEATAVSWGPWNLGKIIGNIGYPK